MIARTAWAVAVPCALVAFVTSGGVLPYDGKAETPTSLDNLHFTARVAIMVLVVFTAAHSGALTGESEQRKRIAKQNGPAEAGPA